MKLFARSFIFEKSIVDGYSEFTYPSGMPGVALYDNKKNIITTLSVDISGYGYQLKEEGQFLLRKHKDNSDLVDYMIKNKYISIIKNGGTFIVAKMNYDLTLTKKDFPPFQFGNKVLYSYSLSICQETNIRLVWVYDEANLYYDSIAYSPIGFDDDELKNNQFIMKDSNLSAKLLSLGHMKIVGKTLDKFKKIHTIAEMTV